MKESFVVDPSTIEFDNEEKIIKSLLVNPMYPIFRKPDGIDAALAKTRYNLRHEHKMTRIRKLNIEQWIRDIQQ